MDCAFFAYSLEVRQSELAVIVCGFFESRSRKRIFDGVGDTSRQLCGGRYDLAVPELQWDQAGVVIINGERLAQPPGARAFV